MPMHDWTRVIAGVFHHFHHNWISAIAQTLNNGLLPGDHYALAEQVADGPIPDVLTLERASESPEVWTSESGRGGLAVADSPPRVRHTLEAEASAYAAKASRVAIHHASGDRVVAYIEIVSPGNKQSEAAVKAFLDKLATAISRNCHLLIVDPHPPTRRDPHGIHARFWADYFGQADSPGVTNELPLSLAAYRADLVPTAYFEPVAVGRPLPPMPIFLTPDYYVNVPLEETYAIAWQSVPARWREVIESDQSIPPH